MFKDYTSIDDLMNSEGKQLGINELNTTPLYTTLVRLSGYPNIALAVTDESNDIKSIYMSQHSADGCIRVVDKIEDLNQATIAAKVPERILLDILYNIDDVKARPCFAIVKYMHHFRPVRREDYWEIAKVVANSARILKNPKLFFGYNQPQL